MRLERYRIKQQTKIALAEASGRARNNDEAYRREMTKVLERHDWRQTVEPHTKNARSHMPVRRRNSTG